MLARIRSNWNAYTLLVEMQNGTAPLANSLGISNKVQDNLTM